MMAKARSQKEQTHELILDSAERLVREKGIVGSRVADVMAGARLTVGGFYAHFESKAELIDATLRRAGARIRAGLFARIDEKPRDDRATVIIKRYLTRAHRDLQTRGCPLPAIVGEIASGASEHRDVLRGEIEAFVDAMREQLPDDGALPPRQLAIALVAMMQGGLALARALRETDASDEVLKACRDVGAFVCRANAESTEVTQ
jgi:TetR/AcrR family transcriptional repressor of nem operon